MLSRQDQSLWVLLDGTFVSYKYTLAKELMKCKDKQLKPSLIKLYFQQNIKA